MPHKDPEARRAYHAAYNAKHGPAYYAANADKIRARNRVAVRARVDALRAECVEAYGSACACCGLADVVFLTFDHVDNDGAEHRRELTAHRPNEGHYPDKPDRRPRPGTYTFLRWIKASGFPDRLQLLCANCQLGKVRNGGTCPHKEQS